MRADARRNAEKLRAAATELFRERGLQVSLKEIARRAGVSHGTLYNLFGTREALIDEVVVDMAAARLDEIATRALACDDAWDGFVRYIENVCELQAADPAISDVVGGRYPGAVRLMDLCRLSRATAVRIIERAQRSGDLRPDFTVDDLLFVFGISARLTGAGEDVAPDVWRRGLAFMLDGLRTEAAHPLPVGPLTPRQVDHVLGGASGTA